MGRPFSEAGLAILLFLLLPYGSLTSENRGQINQDQMRGEPQVRLETPVEDIDSLNGVDFAYKMENSSKPNKTDGTETRVLRLAVFSDDALLSHLSDLHPEDPLAATHSYIAASVLASEELIQQAIGEGVEFKIKLVQVGVWAEKGATPFNTNGLSSSNLLNFCEWASERKPERGDPGYWHHAMMLTGKELFETTKDSLGVTFVGGLCHPRTSCSVVEANSFKAVQVAAHELAHSMGVPHDGEGAAARCPGEGFIMGQSLSEETFDWSNCSRDAIRAFLRNETCLERGTASSRAMPVELDHTKGGPPGQRYPADAQCQLAHGKGFRATPSKWSLCKYLMCTNGVTTRGAHPALPGTSCGTNRICVAGDCKEGKIPPTEPPTEPPTKPPTKPPGNGGGDSVFPPAKIPNEIQYIPIPHRCYFMPPFLHPYIGCKAPPAGSSNTNRPQRPNRPNRPTHPQRPAKAPQPFRISTLPELINITYSEDNYTRLYVKDESVETTDAETMKTIASKSESSEATTASAELREVITFDPESPKTTVSSDKSRQISNNETSVPKNISQETTSVTTKSVENTESSQIPTTESKLPDDEFVLFDAVNEAVESLASEIRSLAEEESQLQDDKENGDKSSEDKDLGVAVQNVTDTEAKSDFITINQNPEANDSLEEVTEMPYTTETITTQTTIDYSISEQMITSELLNEAKNVSQGQTNHSRSDESVTIRLPADDTHQVENFTSSEAEKQTTTIGIPMSSVDEKQLTNDYKDEEESSATFSVDNFTIAGSGLHFSLPSHLLQNLLTSVLMNSYGNSAPVTKKGEDPPVSRRQSEENFDRHHTAHTRISYLRDGYRQEPLLAATAPMHTRAFRISPCTRACGGGTRRVTQVCVETSAPDVVVSQALCNGLPSGVAPFNQSCNTFPCAIPEWVVGPWSPCSHWCGLGLQRRLVACGTPLVEGATPLSAARFLGAGKCSREQPVDVRLCKGSCTQVDCKLPSNRLHPACYHLLGETPIERDHKKVS